MAFFNVFLKIWTHTFQFLNWTIHMLMDVFTIFQLDFELFEIGFSLLKLNYAIFELEFAICELNIVSFELKFSTFGLLD